MKATGVVRRIDELGRIVIPKEIRKNLRIKEGDSLEVFINNDDIILKKYSMIDSIKSLAQELTDSIYIFTSHSVFITDTNTVIAGSGKLKKHYINKTISNYIEKSIKNREKVLESNFNYLNITEGDEIKCSYILSTLLVNGEALGMLLLINEEEKMSEKEYQIVNIVSAFITKYLEQ